MNWLERNIFLHRFIKGIIRPRSSMLFVPQGYRVEYVPKRLDADGIPRFIAYRIDEDVNWATDDWQLGSFTTWRESIKQCKTTYRIMTKTND